jgi:IS30 family transposase
MKNQSYAHITSDERDQIALWWNQGIALSDIAQRLGRNKSSISREIHRNKSAVFDVYLAHKAHARSAERASRTHRRPRLKENLICSYVTEKLQLGWSPEQIAGRLPLEHVGKRISTEAIYQFVYDPSVRKEFDLVPFLTRRHRKRQKKGHRKTHKSSHIPNRIDILRRPKHIAVRKQFGHWESDAAVSRQSKAAINVTTERKSRYTVLRKMHQKSAPQTVRSVTRALKDFPGKARRSLTYDNGAENVDHDTINDRLGTRSYFCQPYHSWEKGTVENTIGLVRRRYPKKTNFALVSQRHLTQLQHRLNNRPRKCLSFKTPNEVFNRCCT